MKHVCVGDGASAAIREDGTVITWGDDTVGADSSRVKDELLYPPWESFFSFVCIKPKRILNILFIKVKSVV